MLTPRTLFGAEIEFAHLGRGTARAITWMNCHAHDDGSVRSRTWLAGTIPVYPQFDPQDEPILSAGMQPDQRYGLELVTEPYAYEEMLSLMQKAEIFFGDVPQTSRTSVHFHVDVSGEPWSYIRNVVRWVRALEAPLFRLACGGKEHRGARVHNNAPNDHRYARPLSMPIGITWGRKIAPLIDWNRLIDATTASEFASSWGRFDLFWGGGLGHYCPHRLHMINFASVYRQGTLEWRIFDGLYGHLATLIQIVYGVHRLAQMGTPDFDDMDLGTKPSIDAQWMSRLLDADCERLWGDNWQKACTVPMLLSHYNDAPSLRTFTDIPVNRIRASHGVDDSGDNFPLYVRM